MDGRQSVGRELPGAPLPVTRSTFEEQPPVVPEAEEDLRRYRRRVAGAAGGWAALWLTGNLTVVFLPWSLLIAPLLGLAGVYVFPASRRGRWAREVLKRWDRLQVDRALAKSSPSGDSRLTVARAMAERILDDASSDEQRRSVVEAVLTSLQRAVRDIETLELAAGSELAGAVGADAAREAREKVELRIARLLTSLGAVHQAVLSQDDTTLRVVVEEAEDLVRRLVAEHDVEVMLEGNRRGDRAG